MFPKGSGFLAGITRLVAHSFNSSALGHVLPRGRPGGRWAVARKMFSAERDGQDWTETTSRGVGGLVFHGPVSELGLLGMEYKVDNAKAQAR